MTIAPFNDFLNALDRQIEKTKSPCCPHCLRSLAWEGEHSASGCDHIPIIHDGQVQGWRPNFDKPGVAERVARDAYDDHEAANPPCSSLGLLLQMIARNRFEASIKREQR